MTLFYSLSSTIEYAVSYALTNVVPAESGKDTDVGNNYTFQDSFNYVFQDGNTYTFN